MAKNTNQTPQASSEPVKEPVTPKVTAAALSEAASPLPTSEPVAQKVTQATATAPVIETVDPSLGPSGEPRSAEIKATVGPSRVPLAEPRREAFSGILPATARVTADGRTTELSRSDEDRTERVFTAATRILRSKKLYEPGAPIPLTIKEFRPKAAGGSIVERDWFDGNLVEASIA